VEWEEKKRWCQIVLFFIMLGSSYLMLIGVGEGSSMTQFKGFTMRGTNGEVKVRVSVEKHE
jgi:hypothetical protein